MEKPPPIRSLNQEKIPPTILPPVIHSSVLPPPRIANRSVQKGVPVRTDKAKARLREVPWTVWIVILITLPVLVIFGPAAAGVALFGGAFGLPLLLLAFVLALAIIGIVTLAKSLKRNPAGTDYVVGIVAQIMSDESMRRVRSELRKAMSTEPVQAHKQPLQGDDAQLQLQLLTMDPFDFERHVMGFFQEKGLFAWVTKKSNDAGVDGFARHKNGLIVVQCKRNSPHVPVGRPVVQQFKGVVEENEAFRGYIVTTSYFSDGAGDSAAKNQRLRLIDMNGLLAWHRRGLDI